METNQVRDAIARKAAAEGIDLSSPSDAFLVAKFTPQSQTKGPLLSRFHDLSEARSYAEQQPGEVYLMSTNPQHGLQSVRDGQLVFIDSGA